MIGNTNRAEQISIIEQISIAEQTLLNERLLLVAYATQDIVRDWNLETNTRWWNPAGVALLGNAPADGVDTDDWSGRIHPDYRAPVLQSLRQAFDRGDGHWSAEYRFCRADATYVYLFDRAIIVYQAGKPIRLVSTIQDITDRMQRWQVSEDRERQLQLALQAAGMGTWHMYPLENRICWDERCQQIYHWPVAQLTIAELVARLHPDDVPLVRGILADPPALQPGESAVVEYRITSPTDGQLRWMRLNGRHYLNEQGVATYYSGTVRDITDEKRKELALLASEKRFEDLVLQAPMPIGVYVGRDMVVQLANDAMLRAWGKDASVIGKPLREAVPELAEQPAHPLLDKVYTTGVTYQTTEDRADLLVDGQLQTFYLNFTYKALRNGDGVVYGVMNMAADVTAQVMARQQIKEAEESLRTAVDLAQLSPWQVYPLRSEAFFSARAKEWLGYEPDELMTLDDVLQCVQERENVKAAVARSIRQSHPGGTLNLEYAVINRKTGQKRILHSYGQAFVNEQGVVYAIVGSSRDITMQRLTEQELERQVQQRTGALQQATTQLEQQADLLEGILLNAPTGLYVCEPVYETDYPAGGVPDNFRFMMVNPLAAKLVGRPVDRIIGQHLTDLFTDIVVAGLLDLVKQTFASGQAQQTEIRYHTNGVAGWYRLGISRHGQRIVLINTDITILKQAEHQAQHVADTLQTMLDGAINGILLLEPVHDAAGTITDFTIQAANRAVEVQTGVVPETAIGRPMLAVYPTYKESGFFDLYINTMRTGRPGRSEYYYQDTRLAGWFEVSVARQGQGLVLTFANSTEAKQAQQQLRQSVEDLRRSNDNLQQFAYVASHDLQEPLRKIQSFGGILRATYAPILSEHGVDMIERMESAAVRMSTLIKDLLSYSRLTTHRQISEPQNLNVIVADVLNMLEIPLLESKAVLDVDSLCTTVPGDGAQLVQLFQNLITNALKFSRIDLSGVSLIPHIQIRCRTIGLAELPADFQPVGQHTGYCVIQVIDNGIGFDPKQAERIFGTFQRLHSRAQYPGTGIGLAIAKKVVENHRGYITAASGPGVGATFTVYLPD